jgi:uncharacterized protein YkwD
MRVVAIALNITSVGPVRASRRVAVAIAAGPLLLTPFPSPASAATAAQCTKLAAPPPIAVAGVRTRTATLTGCTPLSATGGSGTSVTNLDTFVSETTWAGGTGTTVAKVTYKAGLKPNKCPKGSHLTISGGKVIGGSGAALNMMKVGYTETAHWCVTARFAATLEPGSVYKIGGAPSGDGPPPPVSLPAGLSECPASAASAITARLNRDRHKTANLAPLAENANLDWAARKHSIAMAVKSTSFHDGWDTEIKDSRYQVGAPYWTGQNVGWMIAPFDPDTIEAGFFVEVPPEDGHRLNILSTKYHNVGIGCIIRKSTGAIFSTQDFGS